MDELCTVSGDEFGRLFWRWRRGLALVAAAAAAAATGTGPGRFVSSGQFLDG